MSCLHRQSVQNYRDARYVQEQARERITLAFATEEALEKARHGSLITFRDWLKGSANPRPEVTRPPEPADPEIAAAWEAA